jgi:hypothetical protein
MKNVLAVLVMLFVSINVANAKDVVYNEYVGKFIGNNSAGFVLTNWKVPTAKPGDRIYANFNFDVKNNYLFQSEIGSVQMFAKSIKNTQFTLLKSYGKIGDFKFGKTASGMISGGISRRCQNGIYTVQMIFTVVKPVFAISGSIGTTGTTSTGGWGN